MQVLATLTPIVLFSHEVFSLGTYARRQYIAKKLVLITFQFERTDFVLKWPIKGVGDSP
jgi:predicted glycosyltransferase